jgi:hypothetical protein
MTRNLLAALLVAAVNAGLFLVAIQVGFALRD